MMFLLFALEAAPATVTAREEEEEEEEYEEDALKKLRCFVKVFRNKR